MTPPSTDIDDIPFGRLFADRMLVARFTEGRWNPHAITPYEKLGIAPSCAALHYGQSIFEGMKAYRGPDGAPLLFRPHDHFERMNRSARRLCMPELPKELFLDGLIELVHEVRDCIPERPHQSLYLRPLCFATDESIGLRISEEYAFVILGSPAGAYHRDSVSLLLSRDNVRSHAGGTGDAKTSGNYAAGLRASLEARRHGFDDVLWVDSRRRELIEECGTMNVFFVIDDVVVTPPAGGTILPGIVRASALHLLRAAGVRAAERPFSIAELLESHARGALRECFGTGTAASIQRVDRIQVEERELVLPPRQAGDTASSLERKLAAIRRGLVQGPAGWVVRV